VAGVGPDETDPALDVVPEALVCWSTADAPAADERPLYSIVVIAAEAADENFATTVGSLPAPAVIGAVQTLCSVWSGPVKWLTSVNVSPAESVTLDVLAFELLQTPTSTTSRLPAPSGADGVTEMLLAEAIWVLACWTKAGTVAADGVTALDGADGGDVPTAFVAVTVKEYACPFVRPVTVVEVTGGVPVTTVTGWAVAPRYGVTV
jgi:hypothetical protein